MHSLREQQNKDNRVVLVSQNSISSSFFPQASESDAGGDFSLSAFSMVCFVYVVLENDDS